MNTTYAIESTRYTGQLLYSFGESGVLCAFSAADAEIDPERLLAIVQALPPRYEDLERMVARAKAQGTLRNFYELKPQLDFGQFWAAYPRKVAKADAEKAYAKLKDPDKAAAIAYLPAYKRQVARDGVAYLYPASYLHARRWEDA